MERRLRTELAEAGCSGAEVRLNSVGESEPLRDRVE
jgi:hypothetical protein